jgi:hypothetical protein
MRGMKSGGPEKSGRGGKMTFFNTARVTGKSERDRNDLVRRYERIGISAVAGALACEQGAKTAAKEKEAPADNRADERELEGTA